ncbi:ATP-binding protein [Dactylosporangium sp. CS-033363]|uniref:ATP-binding protein n=1 Tax=Dactylosporangium sp. CS-033363 TaxID=3239935 RepID=UPI003D8CF3A3
MQPLCPVLIGRDDLLALADRRLGEVRAGAGHVLFLAGEAGIGKTRLLEAILARATAAGFAVRTIHAYPGDAEVAGGMLAGLDDPAEAEAEAKAEAVAEPTAEAAAEADGDPHRRRRLRTAALAGRIAACAADGPVLLALEDLHWADELTLDALERAARDIATTPLLIVGTYRTDELYPRAPTRAWRARLLNRRLAEEARLGRLPRSETAEMAARIAGAAVPEAVAATLYERSDGVPLHIEEFTGPCLRGDASLPDTLADAVLARAATLSPGARALADAASVIGRSFDLDLLHAMTSDAEGAVDAALRELEECAFVQPGGPLRYDFRHWLIREALHAGLSPLRRRDLHTRAARAAHRAGLRDAFISDQFERAGRPGEAYPHALTAAREAARLSAHREAAELYRRARRTTPACTPDAQRAAVLAELGGELVAVDDNEGAAEALTAAYELFRTLGADVDAAALVPDLAEARHRLGAGIDERDELLREALTLLGDTNTGATRARILAALSAAYMLDRCLDDSIEFGRRAQAVEADGETRINVDATLGAALVFGGMAEGWALMATAVEHATGARLEAEVSRGHRMIGCCASALVEYDRGLRVLREGYAFAERIERFNDRNYMAAHVGHVLWATGDWTGARRWAEQALADGRGDLGTRATALHVLGYLAIGTGDLDTAARILHEARILGEDIGELQRLSPAVWGLAELALHSGRPAEATAWCERGWELSEPSWDAAYLFPFVVTGVRAHLATGDTAAARTFLVKCEERLRYRMIPGTLPALDHARGLLDLAAGQTGRARAALAAASTGWDERHRFWEGVAALRDRARTAHRSRRPAEAATLTAEADRRTQAAGAFATAPLPPLSTVDSAPELLTAREAEVARHVATGATNRQIGAALFISPRTVATHIEHILPKLGASRRAEIAAWVSSSG